MLNQISANLARQASQQAQTQAMATHAMNPQLGQQAAAAQGAAAAAEVTAVTGAIGGAISLVKGMIDNLVSQAQKASVAVLASVAAYKPFQVYLFTRRLMDLSAVFGVIFLPVLHEVIRAVRAVADYLYNLPAGFRAVVREGGRIAVLVAVVGAVAAVAAAAVIPIMMMTTGIIGIATQVGRFFAATAGGQRYLQTAWELVQKLFAGIYHMLQMVWEATAPIRGALADAFSGLGDAMADLYEALEPIAAVVLGLVGGALTAFAYVLGAIATAVVRLVQVLTYLANSLVFLFGWILKLIGVHLPNVEKGTNSAFGLAAQGGHITTDVSGMKTRLEEVILANTGREKDDPAKRTANAAEDISKDLKALREKLAKEDKPSVGARAGAEKALSWMYNPVGSVWKELFGD